MPDALYTSPALCKAKEVHADPVRRAGNPTVIFQVRPMTVIHDHVGARKLRSLKHEQGGELLTEAKGVRVPLYSVSAVVRLLGEVSDLFRSQILFHMATGTAGTLIPFVRMQGVKVLREKVSGAVRSEDPRREASI